MTLTAQVLRVLAQGQDLTRDELAEVVGSTEHQVKKALESLIAQGKLQRVVTPAKYTVTNQGLAHAAAPVKPKTLEMRRYRAKRAGDVYFCDEERAAPPREVIDRLANGIIESAMRSRPAIETAWMGVQA